MAYTISVDFKSHVTVTPTFTGFVDEADDTILIDGLDESLTYTASSTVPVTKVAAFTQALSTGSATINLAALPGGPSGETIDATGLKVQLLKLINPSSNANKITVTKGGSNGYGLDAAGAAWTEAIDPGQSRTMKLNDTAPDVASGARTIDLSGTGSQTLQVIVILG